jgi:hypothetical protein
MIGNMRSTRTGSSCGGVTRARRTRWLLSVQFRAERLGCELHDFTSSDILTAMFRGLRGLAVLVVVAASLGFAPSTMAVAGEPTIVDAQAIGITEQGTMLEAQINPGNGETAYEFWLECRSVSGGSCESIARQEQGGHIASGSGERTVAVNMSGLQPGYNYLFRVAASNAVGRVEARLSFETQQLGACATGCPYKTGPSLAALEQSRKYGEEAPIRQTAREQAAKEQAEREAALAKADQPASATTNNPPSTVSESGDVVLASTGITVQSDGTAVVKLNCLGIESCHGKFTFMAKSSVKTKGKKKTTTHPMTIGTASFTIAGDETKTVRVKLDVAGRALLKADHGRCSASMTILELAPSPENTQTKAVHLMQKKTTEARKS